ncbi:efflux RND transporter periplasmic adaptor subunit [Marimonas arenosa]|uniref:Efflux RND transporter periplasmic adaptor subunit n=1 Tax=Marimonas arenosa TaxID=1795305 RepID=A0AAE3WAS1_9RHOB|nr:efflux RND transporter periplasmic adaptor subunit [Marimonas arenosa]MDQ2089189.1 efflux RND transporter periplasmic adaptor subunit [Marimonas arenosa]
MRLLPLLTALLVSVFLYFLVIDRDTLLSLARGEAPESSDEAMAPPPGQPDEIAAKETAQRAIGVVALHSRAQVIDSAVILRGQTEAARQVQVRSETSGLVISEPLRKGAFVERGQVLCRLDPGTREASLTEARARLAEARARVPEAEAQLPRAEAQLENAGAQLDTARAQLVEAKINYNAAVKLAEGGYASETRVAAAEAAMRAAEAGVTSARAGVKTAEAGVKSAQSGVLNVRAGIQSAEAAVAAAEKEISRLEITAPFEGLLESDAAELGALMQPGAVCATVIQLDPIKLVGFVPETEVDRIAVGSLGGARLSSGDELVGRVTFLSRSADPLTRTFRVEIQVPNPALAIRDGQTVEIAIASDGAAAHLVPQSALTLNDDGLLGVRIVDEAKHAQFVPVTLVRDTAEGVWVTGLPDVADVIVIGQEYVVDGVPVRPSFKEPGT